MYKIRKVEFKGHPILGNLSLDFCGLDGKAVDTIIFAGDNGTGKTTILNEIYGAMSGSVIRDITNNPGTYPDILSDIILEFETKDNILKVKYKSERTARNSYTLSYTDEYGKSISYAKLNLVGIYSDSGINLSSSSIGAVTSSDIDTDAGSRRSSQDLPKQINQLIVDIQNMDDSSLAKAMRENPKMTLDQLPVEERMTRFTTAFEEIFNDLRYDRIENHNNHKEILFKKKGVEIPIDKLSSGEKQIIYRGGFMLRDVNALRGAAVFIDEPEMSLHPSWQMKVMDFYKSIFSDKHGNQTSQIFVATHSPFIIHNDTRRDDKVIVLTRDDEGDISVKDKPEYYWCNSMVPVEDAFSTKALNMGEPTVYLEGLTDEKYFNRALEVYECQNVPFKFKWIGFKANKQDKNSGATAMKKAAQFMAVQNLSYRNVVLYDCDAGKQDEVNGNVYTRFISKYTNKKGMKKGIENALVLDDIDISPYYSDHYKEGDYGGDDVKYKIFEKANFCDYICSLDAGTLKKVFKNLKAEIDKLIALFNEEE